MPVERTPVKKSHQSQSINQHIKQKIPTPPTTAKTVLIAIAAFLAISALSLAIGFGAFMLAGSTITLYGAYAAAGVSALTGYSILTFWLARKTTVITPTPQARQKPAPVIKKPPQVIKKPTIEKSKPQQATPAADALVQAEAEKRAAAERLQAEQKKNEEELARKAKEQQAIQAAKLQQESEIKQALSSILSSANAAITQIATEKRLEDERLQAEQQKKAEEELAKQNALQQNVDRITIVVTHAEIPPPADASTPVLDRTKLAPFLSTSSQKDLTWHADRMREENERFQRLQSIISPIEADKKAANEKNVSSDSRNSSNSSSDSDQVPSPALSASATTPKFLLGSPNPLNFTIHQTSMDTPESSPDTNENRPGETDAARITRERSAAIKQFQALQMQNEIQSPTTPFVVRSGNTAQKTPQTTFSVHEASTPMGGVMPPREYLTPINLREFTPQRPMLSPLPLDSSQPLLTNEALTSLFNELESSKKLLKPSKHPQTFVSPKSTPQVISFLEQERKEEYSLINNVSVQPKKQKKPLKLLSSNQIPTPIKKRQPLKPLEGNSSRPLNVNRLKETMTRTLRLGNTLGPSPGTKVKNAQKLLKRRTDKADVEKDNYEKNKIAITKLKKKIVSETAELTKATNTLKRLASYKRPLTIAEQQKKNKNEKTVKNTTIALTKSDEALRLLKAKQKTLIAALKKAIRDKENMEQAVEDRKEAFLFKR